MKSKWVGRTVGKDGERLMRNHKISKCYLDTSLSMLNPERLVLGCSMPTCRIWPRFVYGHGVRMATSQNFKYCLLVAVVNWRFFKKAQERIFQFFKGLFLAEEGG